MVYFLFSDIHSNLEALEEFARIVKREKPDKVLCLGDIVGYAANPKECIEITQKISQSILAGNHDWATAGRFPLNYFNDYALKAVSWTQKKLGVQEKDFLKQLELLRSEDDFTMVHSRLDSPEDFGYIFTLRDALPTFRRMPGDICFIAHTHIPAVFSFDLKNQEFSFIQPEEFSLGKNKKFIINVGSIGQPRDGDKRACFCIYDNEKRRVKFFRFDYNIRETQTKIINEGLPLILAERLNRGW